MENSCAGVDGCPGGWCAVRWNGERVEWTQTTLFADLMHWCRDCQLVVVDMPIGLPGRGQRRACDLQARKLLGKQASSIFLAPPREALQATSFAELKGWGISLQAFHLLPKIREVGRWLETPDPRIWEGHPELAFRTRTELPLAKKRTQQGREQRQRLLPFPLRPRGRLASHDLLDAAILAVVAGELAQGTGRWLGGEADSPERIAY